MVGGADDGDGGGGGGGDGDSNDGAGCEARSHGDRPRGVRDDVLVRDRLPGTDEQKRRLQLQANRQKLLESSKVDA